MTTGTIETKGTRIFFGDVDNSSTIHQVACPTAANGLGGAADQIDITCLSSAEREYKQGLPNPGQVTVPINFIPRSAAHQALIDLKDSGTTVSWMIAFSDYTGAGPTAFDSDGRLVSPGETTAEFLGYVADFTFDIGLNEIVRGTLTIQRSGAVAWDLPTADLD
jgi:hypothetical protein